MKFPPRRPRSLIYRLFRAVLVGVVLGIGGMAACQHKLIYLPAKYPQGEVAAFLKSGGQRLDYITSQGKQAAWFIPAEGGAVPEHVWILCVGNADLAMNYSEIQTDSDLAKDAFVLFDYPGYGECEGSPNPDRIRESFKALGPMITERCGLPAGSLADRGLIFGHSLGAAAGLIAAEEYGIERAVLISPFTSTMEMSQVMLHIPVGFLVTHRFDNHKTLASLVARGGHAWIFHGEEDHIIPIRMGRQLATECGASATFTAVKNAGHNDLLALDWPEVRSAMQAARK